MERRVADISQRYSPTSTHVFENNV